MLLPTVTWGDLRRIRERMSEHPDMTSSDDLLSNPEMAKESLGKQDWEFVYPQPDTPPDFHLAVLDGSDEVSLLIKTDHEEDTMYTREEGEWVPVEPGDVRPELDYTYVEVEGDATPIWDSSDGNLTLYDFQSVLLDGI